MPCPFSRQLFPHLRDSGLTSSESLSSHCCINADSAAVPFDEPGTQSNNSSYELLFKEFFCLAFQVKSHYGPNLDSLQTRHFVGILVDASNRLHLYVNGIDQGIAAKGIQHPCYAVVDVYGQCEEVRGGQRCPGIQLGENLMI